MTKHISLSCGCRLFRVEEVLSVVRSSSAGGNRTLGPCHASSVTGRPFALYHLRSSGVIMG